MYKHREPAPSPMEIRRDSLMRRICEIRRILEEELSQLHQSVDEAQDNQTLWLAEVAIKNKLIEVTQRTVSPSGKGEAHE